MKKSISALVLVILALSAFSFALARGAPTEDYSVSTDQAQTVHVMEVTERQPTVEQVALLGNFATTQSTTERAGARDISAANRGSTAPTLKIGQNSPEPEVVLRS